MNEKENKMIIKEAINNYYSAIKEYDEDFLLNLLNENRGIIDNLDVLIKAIRDYIISIINDKTIENFFIKNNEKDRYFEYSFFIPKDIFNNIKFDFMVNPVFKINIFKSYNNLSDLDRELGETYYLAHSEPDIKYVSDNAYIIEPVFQISINTDSDFSFSETQLGKKIRHEITHCKANLHEYINNKKRLENKIIDSQLINMLDDSDEIIKIFKRCFYLIDSHEINARAHQIYSELDETNKNLFLKTLKSKILRCDIYEKTINEFNEYINILQYNYSNSDFNLILRTKFLIKERNPTKWLLNLLIFSKNKQILQFQKVAEKWLYDFKIRS